MKKIFILPITLLMLLNFFCKAQYDYFKWKKELKFTSNAIGANTGLAVGANNSCYYIASSSQKVSNSSGIVLFTSKVARSGSNLVYKSDAQREYLFYIGNDNKIWSIERAFSSSSWISNNVYSVGEAIASGSSIEVLDKNQILYVRASDNRIANYWKNSSGSGFNIFNVNALPAASWSNIIYKDNCIFYVANNNKLACLEWNAAFSRWDINSTINSETIATNSKILAASINQVYYIRAADNRVCNYWKAGSQSGYGALSDNSTPAMVRTNLAIYNSNQVLYIGNDGNIHSLYWDDNKSTEYILNTTCGINSNYSAFAYDNINKIYFYSSNNIYTISPQFINGFVYKKGNKLLLNEQPFKPIINDYIADLYYVDLGGGNYDFHIGPTLFTTSTYPNPPCPCSTQTGCNSLLDLDFNHIKSLGFDAIRFNGIQVDAFDKTSSDSRLCIRMRDINGQVVTKVLDNTTETKLFDKCEALFNKAGNYGLKVNHFIGYDGGQLNSNCYTTYKTFLNNLANRFKNNSNLFLLSIMLEADQGSIIDKSLICSTVNDWYSTIRGVNKNHLVSVGLAGGPFSVLTGWDPSLLNVDVLTFHEYPELSQLYLSSNYDPTFEIYKKDMKWIANLMSTTINKPWIVGECGVPADKSGNTSFVPLIGNLKLIVSEEDQKQFGKMSLNNAFASGASGSSWYQFQDLKAGWDNGQWSGVINNDRTLKSIVKPDLAGPDPAKNIFQNCTRTIGINNGVSPTDYYNSIPSYTYRITGTVKNSIGQPIKDALIWGIEGWDVGNNRTCFTLSKSDGSFDLRAKDFNINILRVGATGKIVNTDIWSPVNNSVYNIVLNDFNCIYNGNRSLNEIKNVERVDDILVYPNPASTSFLINSSLEKNFVELKIIDIFGRTVKSLINIVQKDVVDVSELPSGLYMVQGVFADGSVITKKLQVVK